MKKELDAFELNNLVSKFAFKLADRMSLGDYGDALAIIIAEATEQLSCVAEVASENWAKHNLDICPSHIFHQYLNDGYHAVEDLGDELFRENEKAYEESLRQRKLAKMPARKATPKKKTAKKTVKKAGRK